MKLIKEDDECARAAACQRHKLWQNARGVEIRGIEAGMRMMKKRSNDGRWMWKIN